MAISAVINTLNEATQIAECIASVRGFADEIIVCDMHSQDGTAEIAKQLGAKVYLVQAALGDFGRLRRSAITHATGDWILVIDADERLTAPLAKSLQRIAGENAYDVVYLSNLFWYFGGWVYHGIFFRNNWPRFFRREIFMRLSPDGEEPLHNDLSVLEQAPRKLVLPKDLYLEHFAYPTIEKYVTKTVGTYARLEAEQYRRQGRRFFLVRMIGDPAKEFVRSYIFKQGFRDGTRGLILNVLYAAYRFATWANVWFLEEMERQTLEDKDARPKS